MTTLEDRARAIAEKANECCSRSDGYEEAITALAFGHLLEVQREARDKAFSEWRRSR